ncbi:unnamed protein product [Dicrocoelium dendriticum]|nr:unnamed protein product [Dicrocoelium dendriticum]
MVFQLRRSRVVQHAIGKKNIPEKSNSDKLTNSSSSDDQQQVSTTTTKPEDDSVSIEIAMDQGEKLSTSGSNQDSSQTSRWTESDPTPTRVNHTVTADDIPMCAQWATTAANGTNVTECMGSDQANCEIACSLEDQRVHDEYYSKVVTVRDLQTELARLRQCSAEAVVQLERLKSERKTLEYELEKQEAKNNQLAEENAQCMIRVTENRFFEESIQRVKKQLDELATQANQSREERRRLRTECVRTELERRRLVDEYLRLETSRASHQDQLEALRRRRQELELYQEDVLQRQQWASRWEEVAGAVHVVVRIRSNGDQPKTSTATTNRLPYEAGCLAVFTEEKIGIRTNREYTGFSTTGLYTDTGFRTYQFTQIFTPDAPHSQVYQSVASQVKRVIEGYNTTILFHGTRGSGKTYTCMGTHLEPGLASFAVADLLRLVRERETPEAALYVSIVDIYNDRVNCAISKRPVQVKDTGSTVHIMDQKELLINKLSEFNDLLAQFCYEGGTRVNGRWSVTSRSHVFIFVKHVLTNGTRLVHSGTLILGDLASSAAAHSVDLSTKDHLFRRECWHIQRSITKFTSVLQNLKKKKNSTINCRGTRLTELLKPCFTGDSYLTLFLTVTEEISQSLSTQYVLELGKCVMGAVLGPPKIHPQTD